MTLGHRTPDDFAAEMAARRTAYAADGLEPPTHTDPDEVINSGRQAADRLISGHAWSDWVAVGRALVIGRAEAMREAHTNKPEGRLYAAAFARWLAHTGLDRVAGDKGTRSHLLDLIDHLDAVETWRKTLPVNRRLQLNHPRAVRDQWRKSTVVPDPNKQAKPSSVAMLKESVATLSEENQRLKQANGGNQFTAQDRPADVVKILVSMFPASKLTKIRELLGKEIKR
jgi:hypothetical protein